jgi:hypothetical protein
MFKKISFIMIMAFLCTISFSTMNAFAKTVVVEAINDADPS